MEPEQPASSLTETAHIRYVLILGIYNSALYVHVLNCCVLFFYLFAFLLGILRYDFETEV